MDWKIVCEIPVGADAATIARVAKESAGRCSSAGSGAFYWNQEDSEQGGDYDQDMWGRVQYQISGSNIAVTTDVISAINPLMLLALVTPSVVRQMMAHFHSGIMVFLYRSEPGAGNWRY